MRKLIAHRYIVKRNMLGIISLCLLCYFSYHAVLGERSFLRLAGLQRDLVKTGVVYDGLHGERVALESKVVRLRPGTLDRDMLEERVHYVLGYYQPDTQMILQ